MERILLMICDVCGRIGGHLRGCPEYGLAKNDFSNHYCSICKEGILDGEEYIENDDGEYAHWECVDYARDLAKFLGYEIKKIDDEEY